MTKPGIDADGVAENEADHFMKCPACFIALTWIKVTARPMDQYENVAVSGGTKVRLEHEVRSIREVHFSVPLAG